jgi:hypothetical protein
MKLKTTVDTDVARFDGPPRRQGPSASENHAVRAQARQRRRLLLERESERQVSEFFASRYQPEPADEQ